MIPSSTGAQVASLEVDLAAFNAGADPVVLRVELGPVDHRAGQEIGVARILDPDLPHHLADDDLDVLVVDIDALHPVGALHFLDQVVLHRFGTADGQNVVGVDGAFRNPVAGLDLIPFLHPDAGTVGNDIAFLVHVAVDVPVTYTIRFFFSSP